MGIEKIAEGAYFVPSYSEQTIAWSPFGYAIQSVTYTELLEDTESLEDADVSIDKQDQPLTHIDTS